MDRHTDSLSESRIQQEFENGSGGRAGEGSKALSVSLELSQAVSGLDRMVSVTTEGRQQLRTAHRCQLCGCPQRPALKSDLMELSGSMKLFFI